MGELPGGFWGYDAYCDLYRDTRIALYRARLREDVNAEVRISRDSDYMEKSLTGRGKPLTREVIERLDREAEEIVLKEAKNGRK